ncbi:MAG TPA: hypothetical protein VNM92_00295 [Thermoanaerobaculia bacterium]|nr:hypothetical protein [Thermoanaerobaculia bacterium]
MASFLKHLRSMARGWESKSVESQIEAAESTREQSRVLSFSREELERDQKRHGLSLSRTRIERELEEATTDVRRQSLQAALDHLNREISSLDPLGSK